jgi:hypothetical protein
MTKRIKHIGSLLGRVFLLSQYNDVSSWSGCKENEHGDTDYDSLDDFITYEEGDISVFPKPNSAYFYVFFAMSSKIEVFKTNTGFIICDGLYFNKSWHYSEPITFELVEETKNLIHLFKAPFIIFDSVLEGLCTLENTKEGAYNVRNNYFNSYITIELEIGDYQINKVQTYIAYDEKKILIKGIEINHCTQ